MTMKYLLVFITFGYLISSGWAGNDLLIKERIEKLDAINKAALKSLDVDQNENIPEVSLKAHVIAHQDANKTVTIDALELDELKLKKDDGSIITQRAQIKEKKVNIGDDSSNKKMEKKK